MAYFETFIKGEYVEDLDLIEQCAQRFGKLRQTALPEGESPELIAEAIAGL